MSPVGNAAAKQAFNAIARVALLDSAVSTTRASTNIHRSFGPYQKNGQLPNTPCTLIGVEKSKHYLNFSSFSTSSKLLARRSLLKVGETCNDATRTAIKELLDAMPEQCYRLNWRIRRIGGFVFLRTLFVSHINPKCWTRFLQIIGKHLHISMKISVDRSR